MAGEQHREDTTIIVVGTWDGTTMKIYINGMQDTRTTAFEGLITTSFIPVGIGRNGGDGWSEYFDGIIDEAAIYNRALTPEEIQQHYQHVDMTIFWGGV